MDAYLQQIKESLEKRRETDYKNYLTQKFKPFRYVCIYGMGEIGHNVYNALLENDFHINFFCDSNNKKTGLEYKGVYCISAEKLKEVAEETLIVIASANYYYEIKDFLRKQGMRNVITVEPEKFRIDQELKQIKMQDILKNIGQLFEVLADEKSKDIIRKLVEEWCLEDYEQERLECIKSFPQYFPKQLVHLGELETFVDCGAFTGDTFESFLNEVDGKFEKAVLLELSEKTGYVLEENIKNLCAECNLDRNRILVHICGVSDQAKKITYQEDSASSSISEDGQEGYLETLDHIMEVDNVSPTFIKMDIEGEEVNALRGAQRCIQENTPILAICIYHKMEHLWEIPLMIKEMVPRYRIYIRHHTDMYVETVCYAIPEEK